MQQICVAGSEGSAPLPPSAQQRFVAAIQVGGQEAPASRGEGLLFSSGAGRCIVALPPVLLPPAHLNSSPALSPAPACLAAGLAAGRR